MAGNASFIEIGVTGGNRARTFYGALFGWSFEPMGGENFAVTTPNIGAGIHGDDPDAIMVVYFEVVDIDAAVRRVRELGGTAPEPGPEDPRFGRFVECRDDQGVRFGLCQPPARRT